MTAFAADSWISPDKNAKRFAGLGLDAKIFPFLVDATKELPFAQEYFDMIISVDSYQYFGNNEGMLPKLLPFMKKRRLYGRCRTRISPRRAVAEGSAALLDSGVVFLPLRLGTGAMGKRTRHNDCRTT